MGMTKPPVSIVIPAYNAREHLSRVLDGIIEQDYDGLIDVVVVNDGSSDDTLQMAENYRDSKRLPDNRSLRVIDQQNQGAAAATNTGIEASNHAIVCSVDSDVVLHRDWLGKIIEEMQDESVAAAQGYYKTPSGVSFWARMMGYDVEARYDAIDTRYVTQVCTGDTAYRRSALEKTGLFDTSFKYGYDNNMSYRLLAAGYRLVFRKDAVCDHYWKADLMSYIRQQYRSGIGRLQLVVRHSEHVTGDSVSGMRMMMQVPLTSLFFISLFFSFVIYGFNPQGLYLLLVSAVSLGALLLDRTAFAVGVYRKQRDPSVALMPLVHLLRNVVWCWALLRWALGAR